MARLDRNSQFECLNLQILHKGLHAVGDGAEVVVVHLLVLGTLVTHQGASRHQQVGAGRVEPLVNEEILLFPTQIHLNFGDVVVEQLTNIFSRLAYRMERA